MSERIHIEKPDTELTVREEELFNPIFDQMCQTKSMTYASYYLTSTQMNILTRIQEQLQTFLTDSVENLPPSPLVRVPLFLKDFPSCKRSIKRLYDEVAALMSNNNTVAFQWTFTRSLHPVLNYFLCIKNDGSGKDENPFYCNLKEGDIVKQVSTVITNVIHVSGHNDVLIVVLNPLALPFMLYYGVGVGRTTYNRNVMLRLRNTYSKRIYQLISEWSLYHQFKDISIEELKRILCLPKLYENKSIRSRVLERAREEINADPESAVKFDYVMIYDRSLDKDRSSDTTRHTANKVVFTIYKKGAPSPEDKRTTAIKRLTLLLKGIADREKYGVCEAVAERIVDAQQDLRICHKFIYYKDQYDKGRITRDHYHNTLLKIIRTTAGVDLRSDDHIRNSLRRGPSRQARHVAEPAVIGTLF